jgi:hypothetical protein
MKHAKPSCAEQIVLRVPTASRDAIETTAAAEGRSMANMTRRILEHWALDRRPTKEAPRHA